MKKWAAAQAFWASQRCSDAPPSQPTSPPGLAAAQLLGALLRRDLLLDELAPGAPPQEVQPAGTGHASWMGLLRVVRPGGRARRIDVKVYPAEPPCAALAVNYFSNTQVGPAYWGATFHSCSGPRRARCGCASMVSPRCLPGSSPQLAGAPSALWMHPPSLAHARRHRQAFCRATRYWATHAEAAAQRARRASPAATGYKLSDMELLPIAKPCESPVGGGTCAFNLGARYHLACCLQPPLSEHRHARRSDRAATRCCPAASAARHRSGGGAKAGARSSDSEGAPSPRAAAPALGSPGSRRSRMQADVMAVGPPVPCADETALFRALGLSYVPPHMRVFSELT